jgi:glutaconate CoA-transferase, subunit B
MVSKRLEMQGSDVTDDLKGKVVLVTGAAGGGVTRLITPLGVLSREAGELTLSSVNPGVGIAEVRAATGWPLAVAEGAGETGPPTAEELRLLRALDPRRIYLR